ADRNDPQALPVISIDEPTLAMTFLPNNSPFLGKEGKYVTSTALWERLLREKQNNVSLVIEKSPNADSFMVKGRGELQLAILIENMRREGYEFQVSKPEVIYRSIDGEKNEPVELAMIDVADEFVGVVIEMLGKRKGEMTGMTQGNDGYTRLEFTVPSRGLIGFRNEFMTETRGTGILNQIFYEYQPYKGEIPGRNRGALVQMEKGAAVAYALENLQERGDLFIGPGTEVYTGMIIGANSRESDMDVNACKTKKLTNIRAAGSDEAIKLIPPREFSLEQALEYIADDELLEITPKNIRMRKKILDKIERKRSARAG
ncbi:MAG TPA: translational GTPase TypA, partial [Spirochaetota bacterium]|nr:translational GTPase TypA [Spirochaetota bacterium]